MVSKAPISTGARVKFMCRTSATVVAILFAGVVSAHPGDEASHEARVDDVRNAEQAFADAFAARDLERFASFIHPDAVFAGRDGPLQGREAILVVWSRFFESEEPPFRWAPKRVLVRPNGETAMTTGPVFDREGRPIGAFASTWARQPDGVWQVIFDVSPSCPTLNDLETSADR